MMGIRLACMLWLTCALSANAVYAAEANADEEAIRAVIEQRRVAWNAEDVETYARLLTEDADIMSSTGRLAYGREDVIKLYVEQRSGAYRGATITSMHVTRIKLVRPDVALVDAEGELVGARGADGNVWAPIKGLVIFLLAKERGHWLISSIRGVTRIPTQGARR